MSNGWAEMGIRIRRTAMPTAKISAKPCEARKVRIRPRFILILLNTLGRGGI